MVITGKFSRSRDVNDSYYHLNLVILRMLWFFEVNELSFRVVRFYRIVSGSRREISGL